MVENSSKIRCFPYSIRDLRFARWWRFHQSWTSGLWHRVAMW